MQSFNVSNGRNKGPGSNFGPEAYSPPKYALFGAAFFVLVSVGRIQELWPPLYNLPLARIALAISLLGYLLGNRNPAHKIRNSRLFTPAALLVALCLLSIFWSVWQGHTFDTLKDLLLPIVVAFFLMIKLMPSLANVHFMIRVLTIAGAILAAVTIGGDWAGRLEVSTSYDPNDLAMMLVTILPIMIFEGARTKNRRRIVFFAIAAMSALAILLTQSRGGFIALLAVGGLMTLVRYDAVGRRLRLSAPNIRVVFVLLIACVTIWTVLPDDGKERLLSVFDLSSDYNLSDESGRMAIWGRALGFVAEQPYGSGFGTSGVADGMSGGRFKATHNSFIQAMVELGIQGIFIYLLIIWRALKMSGRWAFTAAIVDNPNARDIQFWAAGLSFGLIGFCISGFFLSQAYSWILVVMICLIIGLELALQKREMYSDIGKPVVTAPPNSATRKVR